MRQRLEILIHIVIIAMAISFLVSMNTQRNPVQAYACKDNPYCYYCGFVMSWCNGYDCDSCAIECCEIIIGHCVDDPYAECVKRRCCTSICPC